MKTEQNNLLTTGHAVLAMLETLTATSVPPALAATRTALENLLEEIDRLADQQANPIPPKTRERNAAFAAAGRAAHVVARLVRGHALATRQVALAGQVDFSQSDLLIGRMNRRLQYMRQIHAAAAANATELAAAGLTAELMTDLTAKMAKAEEGLTLPRSHIAARRVATTNLAEAFDKLGRLLRFTLDPLMETLHASDPDSYTRYLTARRVIDRPGSLASDPEDRPQTDKLLATASRAPQPLAA